MSTIDLEALARAVAPLVLAELARALRVGASSHYSTRRGCAPPGWSDAAWKATAPKIPGAYRPMAASGRPGRWTIVPREAFERWAHVDEPKPTVARAWSPQDALEQAGLRRVK